MALLPTDPKQQKKLLIGVIPLLLATAYWFFYYQDVRSELDALAEANETLAVQNHNARLQAARAGTDHEQRFGILLDHIARLEQLIPRVEEVAGLLHAVNQRAHEAGVAIERFTPITSEPGPHYTREVHEIGVIGMYHDIGRFLAAIGSLDRIVTPVDFQTIGDHGPDRHGNLRLEARFRIQTYVLPPPAEEGGAHVPR